MPAIDHEASGPVSSLMQLTAWLGCVWSERAEKACDQSMPAGRFGR